MNDDTFQEVSSFVLSRVNIYLLLSSVLMIIIFGVTALIVFTPIKEYLPGLDRTELKYEVMKMEEDITLLEDSLNARQRYIQNIINVINGRHDTSAKTLSEQAPNYEIIDVSSTNSFDSVLREEIEKESEFSLFNKSESRDLESILMHLFTPVKGVISKEYDKKGGHFGLDIVAPKNTTIMAALDGIVVFADWTLEDGYVLGIQHDNELISFYKHNSVLHKKIGNFVQAGEVVALIGNTGERTSGTHLHFELWYKGASIDPTDYLFLK
jgi:murein DD-endopeptidase MepM/ murein hydrolase activator NlpD